MTTRRIATMGFLLTSGNLESDSNTLELLDDKEEMFAAIRAIDEGKYELTIYRSSENIVVSVEELLTGIEIAKRDVRLTPWD